MLNVNRYQSKVYFQKWTYATLNDLWCQSSYYEKYVSL